MDARYYRLLRDSTPEDYYNAINDPEDELYDIVWDLFEKLVIEPAEIFDDDFRDSNQFRFSIDGSAILEFFPDSPYFERRIDPNPYEDDCDAAGVHLQFSIQPTMSCLFSVSLQIWGASERQAFKNLWFSHRRRLSTLFARVKPMVSSRIPFPSVEHAGSLAELLDNYFLIRDSENNISLQYSFAQADESDEAQNFMIAMAALYHAVRAYCQRKEDILVETLEVMNRYYSGHLPDLLPPPPCVDLAIVTDAG
jgi:hypothetical protein